MRTVLGDSARQRERKPAWGVVRQQGAGPGEGKRECVEERRLARCL